MTIEQDRARARARARAKMKAAAPADDGVSPAVVEDKPGWDWAQNTFPTAFTGAKEFVSGMAEGVGNLPNAVPNVVNAAHELYRLHTDEPGAGPIEPVMDQWMTGTGWNDKSLAEMNPQTPGWEGTRQAGRVAGAASPAGPIAMLAAPVLSTGGGWAGKQIDNSLDPNDQQKWEKTLSTLAPVMARGAAPLVTKAPNAAFTGGGTLLATGNPTAALIAATGTAGAKAAAKGVSKMGVADLLASSLAPMAVDDPRMRGPR
jgi:hypothetical protein